jgi:hypothetical protein
MEIPAAGSFVLSATQWTSLPTILSRADGDPGIAAFKNWICTEAKASVADVACWHIASFPGVAEFGRYRGITDSDEPSARQIYEFTALKQRRYLPHLQRADIDRAVDKAQRECARPLAAPLPAEQIANISSLDVRRDVTTAIQTARQSCAMTGKPQISGQVQVLSRESQTNAI